jgi:hypothetical protein
MYQNVPESCDCSPVNIWVLSLQLVADPLSRFRQNLQVAQNSILD